MLFGNVNQLNLLPFVNSQLHGFITEALAIANNSDDGKYPLSDERVFVIVASTETELTSERKAEIHNQHADIQILLQGEERLGYSNRLGEVSWNQDDLDNDVLFIDNVADENFVDLKPGDFALFYPDQIHRPQCAITAPGKIKKAVIKIPRELFA